MQPPAEPKDGVRCESEVGRRPSRRKGHAAQAGWNEDRRAQARWIAKGRQDARNADANRRCAPVEPKKRNRSEPEGWPPVEPECKPPTQVGGSVPAQPEVAAPAKAGGRPLGELEDAAPAVLRVIKIETPEASASGVFNLGVFSPRAFYAPSALRSPRSPRCTPVHTRVGRSATLFRHNKDAGAVVRDRTPPIPDP
jgi:hypothetical protein